MKKHLIATITAFAMSATGAQAEDARGVWSGTIANTLRVIVQFDKPADGPWEATLKVPAQNLVTRVEDVVVTPERIGFALVGTRDETVERDRHVTGGAHADSFCDRA